MSHEIERKFLVTEPLSQILSKYSKVKHIVIEQRYLEKSGDWTVRVRQTICDGQVEHWLTLKRKITPIRCVEIETPVDAEFYALMASQCGPAIRKIRHEVEHENSTWEIDLFVDPLFDGLVMAEIELSDEEEAYSKPTWAGKEVTHDREYKNARLVKRLTRK